MEKSLYIYKCHKNMGLSLIIHCFAMAICVAFVGLYDLKDDFIWLMLSGISLILTLCSFIYSLNFGWNAPIYFNNEKAWMKIKYEIYEWEWEELTSCKIISRNLGWRNPLSFCIEIKTRNDYKKLVIEYSARIEEKLLQLSVSDKIAEMFANAFK